MNHSTPGLPVHHRLPEFTQAHFHWVRCHPTISSSVIPFSSCPQSFPALGSFPMSQLFASGGQNIGVSASTSILPMNPQNWSPLGWTGWISLLSKGLLRVFSQESSPTPQFKSINSSVLSHPHMTTGKTIALTKWTFVGKVMFLLFNMLSRLVISFLPRSKHLLIYSHPTSPWVNSVVFQNSIKYSYFHESSSVSPNGMNSSFLWHWVKFCTCVCCMHEGMCAMCIYVYSICNTHISHHSVTRFL